MSAKVKAWDYLQIIKHQDPIHITEADYKLILLALIKNGAVHADETWMAESLIEAYESVMGDGEL